MRVLAKVICSVCRQSRESEFDAEPEQVAQLALAAEYAWVTRVGTPIEVLMKGLTCPECSNDLNAPITQRSLTEN